MLFWGLSPLLWAVHEFIGHCLGFFLVQFSILVPLHSCQTFGRTSLTIRSKYATEMGDGRMRDDRIDHQRKKQDAPWVKIVPFSQNYHQPKWKLLRNNNHNGYALWNHWEWSVFRLLSRPLISQKLLLGF